MNIRRTKWNTHTKKKKKVEWKKLAAVKYGHFRLNNISNEQQNKIQKTKHTDCDRIKWQNDQKKSGRHRSYGSSWTGPDWPPLFPRSHNSIGDLSVSVLLSFLFFNFNFNCSFGFWIGIGKHYGISLGILGILGMFNTSKQPNNNKSCGPNCTLSTQVNWTHSQLVHCPIANVNLSHLRVLYNNNNTTKKKIHNIKVWLN